MDGATATDQPSYCRFGRASQAEDNRSQSYANMSHPLDVADFRSQRWVLDPDDFALSDDRPDPPPSDLIAREVWHGMTVVPSDVSIRTSDHRGTQLKLLYAWWGDWVAAVGDPDAPDVLFDFMLEAADNLA